VVEFSNFTESTANMNKFLENPGMFRQGLQAESLNLHDRQVYKNLHWQQDHEASYHISKAILAGIVGKRSNLLSDQGYLFTD
jgi:hypothetical protein